MATKNAQKGKATSGTKRITERLIRKRAQEIYLQRMDEGIPGDAESDWLQAEQELKND